MWPIVHNAAPAHSAERSLEGRRLEQPRRVETLEGKISYEAIGQLTPSLNKGIMYHTAVLTLISRRAFCTCTKRSSHLWSGGVARTVTVSKLTPLTETPLAKVGSQRAGARILESAVAAVIAEGRSLTYDLKPSRDDPTAVGTQERPMPSSLRCKSGESVSQYRHKRRNYK